MPEEAAQLEALRREVAQLRAERDIMETFHRYIWGIDYGDPDMWADCFTEDGVYWNTFPAGSMPDGDEMRLTGRQELYDFVKHHRSPPEKYFKHFVWSPIIEVDGDTARAKSIMGRMDSTDSGPVIDVYGFYEDDLIRGDDGRWRFVLRHSTVEALAPTFKKGVVLPED